VLKSLGDWIIVHRDDRVWFGDPTRF